MAHRIQNLTNGFTIKHSRAQRAVNECAATWVEHGVSIRNLTLAESIAARNEQARMREPLPYAEIPGLRFSPTVSGINATRAEGRLMWEAQEFVAQAA